MKYSIVLILVALLVMSCGNNNAVRSPSPTTDTIASVSEPEEDGFSEKINKLVLSEHKIGRQYFFKEMLPRGVLEYEVCYLGAMRTRSGDTLKFLNHITFAGLYEDSKKASATVNIYDVNNDKIGFYYVGGVLGVPTGISNGHLIFSFNQGDCNQTTSISFIDSIPKQIFVACTKDGGNLWTFTK